MPDMGLRARVERLLRGDLQIDDLTRLFLYARDRCDGRETVQEIGDFVAHHDERTKGIITRETRDWFITTRVMMSAMKTPLQSDKLPTNFREFLAASLRRLGAGIKQSGFRLRDAHHILRTLSTKFIANSDSTLAISPRHTQKERALIAALSGHITARPAFTSDRLFQDFSETLKSNALLERTELRDFIKLQPAISLFAVSVMHNCVIQIGGGLTCKLTAFAHGPDGTIEVNAPVPTLADPAILVSSSIYSAGLPAAQYCDAALLSAQKWDFDLEVTEATKLAKLG